MQDVKPYNYKTQAMTKKLQELQIESIAKESGFFQRVGKKLTPLTLVLGFYSAVFENRSLFSFSNWAYQISQFFSVGHISKQGIFSRINAAQVTFAQDLLDRVLNQRLESISPQGMGNALFADFTRVLLQDSTVIKLAKHLSSVFKGPNAKGGGGASIRLQHIFNLKRKKSVAFSLNSYTDNDQKDSKNILSYIKEGDLVIRDLGYFALNVFGEIHQSGAFFLSRYKYKVNIYDVQTKEKIDLTECLTAQKILICLCC